LRVSAKADVDAKAAVGPGVGGEFGAVDGDDGADDGQAESVPVGSGDPWDTEPLERLEEAAPAAPS
jgi:hypothetical protein